MANCLGKILVSDIDEMVKIVAGLVKEGIVFSVRKYDDNNWIVEMNGGY